MFQEPAESSAEPGRLAPATGDEAATQPPPPSKPTATTTTTTTAGAGPNLATKAGNQQQPQHGGDAMPPGKTSYSVGKQQMAATALHQHYLNYFNSNIPREETKSHHQPRAARGGAGGGGLSSNPQENHHHNHHPPQTSQQRSTNHNTTAPTTSRTGHYSMSSAHPAGHNHNHIPAQAHTFGGQQAAPREEGPMAHRLQQQQQHNNQQQPPQHAGYIKSRAHSTGAHPPSSQQQQQQAAARAPKHNWQERQLQQDRDSEEATATTIKDELEHDLQGCKTSELEAISSLERNLPIELSFLIRQQAHCMARMNYLDRQIRELKEAAQQQQVAEAPRMEVSSSSMLNQNPMQRPGSHVINAAVAAATTTTMGHHHHKNGNFILSDDSGGEYSRATISDDDELSSLLDQIAKSVRPERPGNGGGGSGGGFSMMGGPNYNQQLFQQQQQQQQQQRFAATMSNSRQPQPQQSYAIINPGQLHHQQAVPIFVMGSPIAVAHPSSINSNILPGVHFQPRYNQFYEDFYYSNAAVNSTGMASSMVTTMPTMQRHGGHGQSVNNNNNNNNSNNKNLHHSHHQHHHHNLTPNGHRSQQFDASISAVEQPVVSQKE